MSTLPAYRCHKIVRAAKVASISIYDDAGCRVLTLNNGSTVSVHRDSQFKNTEPGDYYVVYDDNYASRSPAAAFEAGYRLHETFQDRVHAERADLAEKVDKLGDFLASPGVEEIDPMERDRLTQQREAMSIYLDVLDERIAAFEPPPIDNAHVAPGAEQFASSGPVSA